MAGRLKVQIARGLVGNDNLGLIQQRTGYRYVLLLAARQLMGHLVELVEHAHLFQYGLYALSALLAALPAGGLQHKFQIAAHGAVVEQLEVLEDNAHLLAKGRHVLALDVAYVHTQHFGFLRVVMVQLTVDGFQKRALAGSYLAYDIHEVAFFHLEGDIRQNGLVLLVHIDILVVYQHVLYRFFMIYVLMGTVT